MTRQITPAEAARFYDRLGKALDTQRFYEDPAADEMIAHGDFGQAASVVDFGCGTGRLLERLLEDHLPRTATALGVDVSARMVEISAQRLARFGERVRVAQNSGEMVLPLGEGAADRVIATYVLDLLSEEDAKAFIGEAHRVMAPGGLLCLVSLTEGQGPVSRTVCSVWNFIHRLDPAWTGGCRPIRLLPLLGFGWSVRYRNVIVRWGVPSEIVVAARAE